MILIMGAFLTRLYDSSSLPNDITSMSVIQELFCDENYLDLDRITPSSSCIEFIDDGIEDSALVGGNLFVSSVEL